MKTIVSLAVALAAIPAGAVLAAPPAPPPSSDLVAAVLPDLPPSPGEGTLRTRVAQLSAQARAHAIRLGLTASPPARLSASPAILVSQEQRLAPVVAFLAHRRQVDLAVDERPAVPAHPGMSLGSARLAREYATVTRLTRRLGLDRSRAPRAAATPQGRAAQLGRWRAVARWLAHRSEVIRPDERPLSARIPHYAALTCIADHESHGTWDISTGNGYYGGLQMDRGFQQTYAPALYRSKGTADNWTAEEQMRAAEQAIASRGFTPWPNTARMCGLL